MQRLTDLRRRLSVEINALKSIYQQDLYTVLPYCKKSTGLCEVFQDVVLRCNGDTLVKRYMQMYKHYQTFPQVNDDEDDTICDVLLETLKSIYKSVTDYQNEISKALSVVESELSVDALRNLIDTITDIAPHVIIPAPLTQCLKELQNIHDLHSQLMSQNWEGTVYDERFLVKNDVEIQMENEDFVRRGQENFEKFNLELEEKSQKVANHQLRSDPKIIS